MTNFLCDGKPVALKVTNEAYDVADIIINSLIKMDAELVDNQHKRINSRISLDAWADKSKYHSRFVVAGHKFIGVSNELRHTSQ